MESHVLGDSLFLFEGFSFLLELSHPYVIVMIKHQSFESVMFQGYAIVVSFAVKNNTRSVNAVCWYGFFLFMEHGA